VDTIRAFLSDPRDRRYFCLHGLAGTGKTTVLAALAREAMGGDRNHKDGTIPSTAETPAGFLLAPTGKAGAVLARKTGLPVSTLHKCLYMPEETPDGGVRFHKAVHPGELDGCIALVDEASMIDHTLAADLLETGLRVIACGDPGQLPPVRGEQFFSQADFVLTEVRRQARDSGIIRQAHAVRRRLPYTDDGDAFRIVDRRDTAALDSVDIVLCWKNETRHRLNRFIRSRRGIFGQVQPLAGEPLICLENRGALLNGEIRTVAEDYTSGDLQLDGLGIRRPWFEWLEPDGRWPRGSTPFGLAYAITVHKAQGSEWPVVGVVDDFTGRLDRERWLYTAVTRASKAVRIWRP
jgi:exodeoxyribonuclease V